MAHTTLGVSLGSRTAGVAIIKDKQLVVAQSLTLRNRSTTIHTSTLDRLIRQYRIKVAVVKTPPATHLSQRIKTVLQECVQLFSYHGCMVEYTDTRDIRQSMPEVRNKVQAMRHIAEVYPQLMPILEREAANRQKYHMKLLEAATIAHIKHTER
jgi:RNase H-fold protein (predicted Holliday junction resolvase)